MADESSVINLIVRFRDLASQGMRNVQKEMGQLGNKADAASKKTKNLGSSIKNLTFGSLATRIVGATAAFAGITTAITVFRSAIVGAVTTGAKFEKTMVTAGAVARATKTEFIALNDIARKMGEETEWSATQAAEALKFLGMAGFNAGKSIKALPGVLDLATAANIDLAKAADISTNALTAMGLPVEKLSDVNDVFVGTITRTNTNMEMMAESFKYSAPSAKAFGYSIRDLSAMIGTLGNAGIQGSMAGTQLSFAFTKVSKVAKQLGLKDGANLVDVLKALDAQFKSAGMTSKQIADEMLGIFGQRAGRAALVLKEALIPGVNGTASAFEKLRGELDTVNGETERLAKKMRDTVEGAFDELRSVIETVGIDAFNAYKVALKETIKDIVAFIRENKHLVKYLPKVTNALLTIAKVLAIGLGFKYLIGLLPVIIAGFKGLVFAIEETIWQMVLLDKQAIKSSTFMKGFGASVRMTAKALFSLKGALNVAMAALAGWEIGSYLYDNFEEARLIGLGFVDSVIRGWINIKTQFKLVMGSVGVLWDHFIDTLYDPWIKFIEYIEAGARQIERVTGDIGLTKGLQKYRKDLEETRKPLGSLVDDLKSKVKEVGEEYKKEIEQHEKTIDLVAEEHQGYGKIKENLVKVRMQLIKNRKKTEQSREEMERLTKAASMAAGAIKDVNKSDPRILEARLKSIVSKAGELAKTWEDELNRAYEKGIVGIDDYYNERERLIKDRLDREVKLLRKQLSIKEQIAKDEIKLLKEQAEDPTAKPKEKQKALDKIAKIERDIATSKIKTDEQVFSKEQQYARGSEKLTSEKEKKEEELAKNKIKFSQEMEDRRLAIKESPDKSIFEQHEVELEALDSKHESERNALIDQNASLGELRELQSVQELEKEKKKEDQKKAIQEFQLNTAKDAFGNLSSIAQSYYELSGKQSKEAFVAMKAASIAETIISTYQAAQNAFTSLAGIPYVGPALGAVAAAAAIATGMMRVNAIRQQKMAEGGEVEGYSPTPTSDNIPAYLTAGEYVQPVSAVQYYGKETMEAIRRKMIPKSLLSGFSVPNIKVGVTNYAQGGVAKVGPQTEREAKAGGGQPPITINNIVDPAQMDRHLVSRPGQQSIMNVLSDNQFQLKQLVFQQ